MKKSFLIVVLLLVSSCLFAISASYGFSVLGEQDVRSFGGVGLDLGVSFFEQPYLEGGVELVLSPFFEEVFLYISSYPLSILKHPFDFVTTNKSLYSPGVRLGGAYVDEVGWIFKSEISLITLRDNNFRYEFFSPILTYVFSEKSFGWGLNLMRISYTF